MRWTAGNVLRLVAVVVTAAGILAALLFGGWFLGRDEAASHAAVRDYVAALAAGETTAEVVTVSCSRGTEPLAGNASVDVAGAFDPRSLEGAELLVDVGHDVEDGRRHEFEVRGVVRGIAVLERTDADRWRVCGLLPLFELLPPA